MNAKPVETHAPPQKGRWWTVPQALVWIVSRSEAETCSARGIKFLPELHTLRLHPFSPNDDPPISLDVAPDEFVQAARTGQVAVLGREGGKGKSERVPMGKLRNPELKARDGGLCIVENLTRPWEASYWSSLSVRADECMRRWLGDTAPKDGEGQSEAPADRTTDEQKREWMFQHQRELKDAEKRYGREVILSAARKRFGVRHKVVSGIWNDAASKKQRLKNSRARKSK